MNFGGSGQILTQIFSLKIYLFSKQSWHLNFFHSPNLLCAEIFNISTESKMMGLCPEQDWDRQYLKTHKLFLKKLVRLGGSLSPYLENFHSQRYSAVFLTVFTRFMPNFFPTEFIGDGEWCIKQTRIDFFSAWQVRSVVAEFSFSGSGAFSFLPLEMPILPLGD